MTIHQLLNKVAYLFVDIFVAFFISMFSSKRKFIKRNYDEWIINVQWKQKVVQVTAKNCIAHIDTKKIHYSQVPLIKKRKKNCTLKKKNNNQRTINIRKEKYSTDMDKFNEGKGMH